MLPLRMCQYITSIAKWIKLILKILKLDIDTGIIIKWNEMVAKTAS